MGIITVMVLAVAIFVPAMLIEGICSMFRRAKEAWEWRKIKKIYY
jgi:hypothetical protein